MSEIIYPEESYKIMGACFEVDNDQRRGFLAPVHQECMELEPGRQGIPARPPVALPLTYKGVTLPQKYRPDFDGYGKTILELKAVDKLADGHVAQVLNYRNATGCALGLLVNSGSHPKLEYRRIARTQRQ